MGADHAGELQEQVRSSYEQRTALCIRGAESKAFYGRTPEGAPLNAARHRGVIHYESAELVMTARCGTPLKEIESALAKHNQMLAFEPPHYAAGATLGGTVACGIAGPRRAYGGSVRDAVLGVRCISGEGKILRFGGEVVKNVAGFDAFRLMTGAMGTLGVLLDVSLRVVPQPERELTLSYECGSRAAVEEMTRWSACPLPVSATAHDGERLYLRLEGTREGVDAAKRVLGGERVDDGPEVWRSLREQQHPFFSGEEPLWRLSVPPATPPSAVVGRWLIEWGGAQRWLKTALPANIIRETAARAGGHATRFRGGDRDGAVFHPLSAPVLRAHKALKNAFDPRGILNPQRMYAEF